MTGAKDPDEFIQKFGAERFSMLLDGSRGALDFELSKLRAQFDTGTPEGKVGFLKEACRLFAGVRNPVEREVYITQTANELQIAPQAIKAQIQNLDKQDYYRDRSRQRKGHEPLHRQHGRRQGRPAAAHPPALRHGRGGDFVLLAQKPRLLPADCAENRAAGLCHRPETARSIRP